jgi:hypothetical protein
VGPLSRREPVTLTERLLQQLDLLLQLLDLPLERLHAVLEQRVVLRRSEHCGAARPEGHGGQGEDVVEHASRAALPCYTLQLNV